MQWVMVAPVGATLASTPRCLRPCLGSDCGLGTLPHLRRLISDCASRVGPQQPPQPCVCVLSPSLPIPAMKGSSRLPSPGQKSPHTLLHTPLSPAENNLDDALLKNECGAGSLPITPSGRVQASSQFSSHPSYRRSSSRTFLCSGSFKDTIRWCYSLAAAFPGTHNPAHRIQGSSTPSKPG